MNNDEGQSGAHGYARAPLAKGDEHDEADDSQTRRDEPTSDVITAHYYSSNTCLVKQGRRQVPPGTEAVAA